MAEVRGSLHFLVVYNSILINYNAYITLSFRIHMSDKFQYQIDYMEFIWRIKEVEIFREMIMKF